MTDIRLRPLRMDDLDNMMTWVNDSEVIGNFARFDHHITREEEANFLKQLLASKNDKTYAIENTTGEYICNVSLNQIYTQTGTGRLGITLTRDARGHSYGPQAIQQVINLAFNEHKLRKVWAIVSEKNLRMQHIVESVGMKLEARLEKEYLIHGEYVDMLRYRIFNHEYKTQKAII